jgi:peroxiredoxin
MLQRIALSALITAVLAAPAASQPARVDLSVLGPQIGQRIPEFKLVDQQGQPRTFDSIAGAKGAMLVFSRSIDWCPYCKTQVLELQTRVDELRKQGLGIAVITYDAQPLHADFARRRGITLPLLADPGSATIRSFGILNTTVEQGSQNFGIPFPGTFLVDRNGVVTARFFEDAYQERNTVANIMLKLGGKGSDRLAKRMRTDHLTATTYASDEVVAPGSLFSLVFDVEPNAGVHVYAPGEHDYKVIGLELDANPLVVVRPLSYPASEIYHFKPLDERVPVFQKPFRLVHELAVSASREARPEIAKMETVTITGRFHYQACDDKVCFNPVSLPVSYTFRIRQLDTERAVR